MVEHLGKRIKHLVDNKFKTKKEFAKAIGLKQETYVFEIFNKEDINTALLRKISKVLDVSVIEILSENLSVIAEPKQAYGKYLASSFDKKAKVVVEFNSNDVLNLNIDIKNGKLEILKQK